MLYYILLLYYIVEYTLRTNNGIIFMLFTSFITFIYTFYCYSFITRLFAFAIHSFPFCSSLQHCPCIVVWLRLHSNTPHSFDIVTVFGLASFPLARTKKEAKKKEVYYILYLYYIFFLCILILFTFFWFFSFFLFFFISFLLMEVCICMLKKHVLEHRK